MGIDTERVLAKIAFIREQTKSINRLLTNKSREEIVVDSWLIKGLKYSLQTAVEGLIDISYHIAAKEYGHAPVDDRDAIRLLTEEGLIPKDNVRLFYAMIGFRNRVVHGYQEVSTEMVYDIAHDDLNDFEKFISDISQLIKL